MLLSVVMLLVWAQQTTERQPAFPGAEGYGRYVTGGRGGKVYHVTNLNNSGTGSLRWALSQSGTKTIVFDVSGTIHLQSALNIGDNVTIAGQTAPGDGICVADYPCSIKGSDVIVRYMRFRLGNKNVTLDGADGWDGCGGFDQQDIIIDHCSVSWSIDECLSVLGNKNTTVQWCLVAQSLVNSGHSKGAHGYGGNWGGSGASFHHNLLAHHSSRTPRLGPRPTTQLDERMDMRNNVIYNFGGNGCYGGEAMKVNIVNNYYKPGPGTPTNYKGKRIAGIGIRTNEYVTNNPSYAPALHIWGKYFVEGNVNSKYSDVTSNNWTYGIYNQINANDCDGTYTQKTKDTIRINTPIPFVYTTTHTATQAYERVLNYAGASLSRDAFDQLMVSDTRNGVATYTGENLSKGFINTQDDNKPSGASSTWSAWPTLNSTSAPVDTDGDGMPDTWEDAHGLDKSYASDGATIADNGYTNVENYINSLVEDITEAQNEGGTVMGATEENEVEEYTYYDISAETSNGNWTFTNGFSFTESGTPAIVSKTNYIKFSRNHQYTINIPDGITIDRVTITGNMNMDSGTAYLYELNGQLFETTDYVFPSRTANDDRTYTIDLASPATKTLTFTAKGDGQVGWQLRLYSKNESSTPILMGDVNGDGLVNITDVVCLVNYILHEDSTSIILEAADLNDDGAINITDAVALVNLILQ